MPGDSGVPVVTNSCAYYHCTRGCGCIDTRHSPRPLLLRAAKQFLQNSRESRRGNAEAHLKLFGCLKTESVAMNAKAPHPQSSSPGLPPSLKLRRAREIACP